MASLASVLPTVRGEFSKLKAPGPHDKVYNDECMYSFDSPFSDTGLYVSMSTWMGYGEDFYLQDAARTGNKLYVHLKWTQVPLAASAPAAASSASASASASESAAAAPEEAVTKLAIGVGGGFVTEARFDIVKEHALVVVCDNGPQRVPLPHAEVPEFVSNVAMAIIDHNGMKSKMQVDSWDASNEVAVSKYAEALIQLPADRKISQDPSTWQCAMSGERENLWLNLSTGYIGGGRKNWDGTGGSGAALQHYRDTGGLYPLCVKLGTITANSADVWSYADDEDCLVIDPLLPQHLAHWGIDIMRLEKTDKSMTEMEVELNMKYDWSRIMESGEKLEPLTGPGYVGLRNIGSSCYLNAVMQSVLAVPEVQQRYLQQAATIFASAPADPSTDLPAQLSKLAVGVLTGRYAAPVAPAAVATTTGEAPPDDATLEKHVVAPRMFKQLVSRGNKEFSSSRQQDASEYLTFFLDVLAKAEHASLRRLDPAVLEASPLGPRATQALFEFHVETRRQCARTGQVWYSPLGRATRAMELEMQIPLHQATNRDAVEAAKNRKKQRLDGGEASSSGADDEDDKLIVPFAACVESYFGDSEVHEFRNPSLGPDAGLGRALQTVRLATFPPYLIVKMARYLPGENWCQVKVDARVPVPEELDLSAYRARGLQPGEVPVPDAPADTGGNAAGAAAAAAAPDASLVQQLMAMGFSENGSRRAALATRNADVEAACSWVFEHMEDPDFNDPLPAQAPAAAGAAAGAGAAVSADAIAMMEAMGVGERHARAALTACDGNVERAVDWVFSRDDLEAEATKSLEGGSAAAAAAAADGPGGAGNAPPPLDGPGTYTLFAVISHIGKSTDHGHYVAHIKKDGQWAFFNDEKVARSKAPPLEHGFIYLFRRKT